MYNPYSLEGKSILVTGASSGIGRATAIICSKLGAKVIITARNEAKLKQTLFLLEGYGHQYLICDLQSSEQVDKLVNDLPELQGLVNNAGTTITAPVQFINEDNLKSIFQTNTVSQILLMQKLLKKKKLKRGSSVVFTSSMAARKKVTPGNSMYCASKGAISSFVECAALELGPKGIRVNAVCPGMTDTPFIHSDIFTVDQLKEDGKKYPLGVYGQPEDIGYGIAYLLSNAAKWVTGTNMVIDGGLSVRY